MGTVRCELMASVGGGRAVGRRGGGGADDLSRLERAPGAGAAKTRAEAPAR